MIAIASGYQEVMPPSVERLPEQLSTPDRKCESLLGRMSGKTRKTIIALICGVGIVFHGISFTRTSNEMRAMTVRESLEHFEKYHALEHGTLNYSVLCALRNGNKALINANIDSMNFGEFQNRLLKDEPFFHFVVSAIEERESVIVARQ